MKNKKMFLYFIVVVLLIVSVSATVLRDTTSVFSGDVNTTGYYHGQPLDGSIGSGIIWCDDVNSEGDVNLSINGLNITYPDMIVRLARSDNVVKYCNISSDTITMPENTHLVFYVDNTCMVKNTSFNNYITTDLSPGGLADIFSAYAVNGVIEMFKGATVKNKEEIKTRKSMFRTAHLRVYSGMNLDFNTVFPEVYQYGGEYLYVRTLVNTLARNSTVDGIHLVSHINGSWDYVTQTGINLTHCDNTTDLVQCPTNKYRRYVIYTIGKDSTTQLHQLAPLTTDTTYNNLGDCLDIVNNPISYTLPSEHEYLAVPTYIYCGLRDANTWDDGWIDIRGGLVSRGAVQDLSNYLSYDGLTKNWDQGNYNFTNANSWFLGLINWSSIQNKLISSINNVYLYLSGSTLFFNESKLNNTIDARDDDTTYTNSSPITLSGTTFGFSFCSAGNSYVGSTCTDILTESELDSFAELNTQISDASLLKSGGALTINNICEYDGSGIDCNLAKDNSGSCSAGAVCLGGHTHPASEITAGTFGSGSYIIDTNLTVENLHLETGGLAISENSTCRFLYSPSGTTRLEICD